MSGAGGQSGLIEGVRGRLNERFRQLPSREQLEKTVESLRRNGLTVYVEPTAADALSRFQAIVPEGAEVFTGTSRSLEETGIAELVDKSWKYRSLRAKLATMDRNNQMREMVKLGATPEYIAGSVHAVTEQGQAVIASATGSQLGPYSASAGKVVWVVGTQKIVRDLEEAFQRIREYAFVREDERAQKAYGKGSSISKLLIVQKELTPDRITVIFVPAVLGF
ncbi:MAG: LUD domain-containing protein [Thermoplasmata archaeon]